MSTGASYKYKGVVIEFNTMAARFDAAVGTKRITAPSLDAIKKKIDNEQAVKFEPFAAVDYEDGKFITFNVTHMAKGEQRHHRGDVVFVTDHPRSWMREQVNVVLDIPENRALLEAASKKREEVNEKKKRLDAELDAARLAIPHVHARDYGVKK